MLLINTNFKLFPKHILYTYLNVFCLSAGGRSREQHHRSGTVRKRAVSFEFHDSFIQRRERPRGPRGGHTARAGERTIYL